MTKTDKAYKEVVTMATNLLGKPSTFGHFTFLDKKGKKWRLKMQNTSWRLEASIGSNQWVRIKGEYYIKTDINELNRIIGELKA